LADSEQIIALYQYDRSFANHILRYILKIEKILNTAVAYSIIDEFHIQDACLFKLNKNFIRDRIFSNLDLVEPHISYERFIDKILKYCQSNEFTKIYELKNQRNQYSK